MIYLSLVVETDIKVSCYINRDYKHYNQDTFTAFTIGATVGSETTMAGSPTTAVEATTAAMKTTQHPTTTAVELTTAALYTGKRLQTKLIMPTNK